MDSSLIGIIDARRPGGPDELTVRLRIMVNGRASVDEAARRLGIDPGKARRRLAAVGCEPGQEPSVETLADMRQREGLTVEKIAQRCGLTPAQVQRRLRRAAIRAPSKQALRAGLPASPDQAAARFRAEVVRLYVDEGLTQRQVAQRLRVAPRTVWNELVAAGVPRRPRGPQPRTLPAEVLVDLYVNRHLPALAVAARLGVSDHVLNRALDAHGISRHRARPRLSAEELEDLYVRRALSIAQIAERVGLTREQVRADLHRHGIPTRPPGGRKGMRRRPRPPAMARSASPSPAPSQGVRTTAE